MSDAGLAHFKDCKNLIQLWVPDTQVSDAGLVHFQDCKALTDLNLAGTKVSDVGLAHFKDCKNLTYLYLDRTQVGDAGLAHFKGMPLRELSIDKLVHATVVGFAAMTSATLMLCVLWERSPVLAATLVGPFLAISLYQRSVLHAFEAMELALTDPLSKLGNHRHFQQELERLLADADETGRPLTLCLLDVDEFKSINDQHGHPVGDRILALVGHCLHETGAAFRLGGDEFALFMRTATDAEAVERRAHAVARIGRVKTERGLTITISAGLATYPSPGLARADVVRAADSALYAAKAEGKAAVRMYRHGVVPARREDDADRRARLRAAVSLAGAIDVRDAYTGTHSHAVGELAARIGDCLGLTAEEVELLRIAGLLHDLGKVAVPEHILSKPGPLTETEHEAIALHPLVGYRMLTSLRIEPVATWVLHHHERYDGHGYPDGLTGEEIPIGSRILPSRTRTRR